MPPRLVKIAAFLRRCFAALETDRSLVLVFMLLSLAATVTEGLGVSLLIPFLQPGGSGSVFADKPVFGDLMRLIELIPEHRRLAAVAGLLLIVIVLRGILLYSVQVLTEILPLRIQRRMMEQGYQGLINVEISYLARNQVGTVTSAVSQLPVRISTLIIQVAQGLFSLILAAGYTVLMLALSWSLTLVTVAFFGLTSLVLRNAFTRRLSIAGAEITNASADNATLLHETINGLRLIRLSSAEATMSRSFNTNTRYLIAAQARIARIRSMPPPLLAAAAGAFICALLAGGSIFVGTGGAGDNGWVTSILLFNILVFRLLTPVTNLNTTRQYILSQINAFDEYDRFLQDMADNRQSSGDLKIDGLKDSIRFETVGFSYPASSQPALSNFSLTLAKGSMTALVGPSGAGKSTVAGLLARLYDPTSGRIVVNGTDLRTFNVGSWHRLIGYVSQEAFIFNDTLANNMRFVRSEASDEDVLDALNRAAAGDILAGMPDGLQTILGERGTRLSGGQIQRIALARVLLADPELLILDEATSALDSITEAIIQQNIERLRQGRTVLAIAHRLSTIARADTIAVLDGGTIREQGTHETLQQNSEIYRELLRHQATTATY